MLQVFLSVFTVLLGLLLFQLGNGLIGTLLSVRLNLAGFDTEIAGLVASAYYAGLMGGAILANNVIAAVGHIRAYASLAALYASAALLIPILDDPNYWYPLRFIGGFCVAGMYMVIESWLNATVDNRSRGRILSLYMIVTYSGLGIGQFMLDLDDPLGHVLFSVIAICFALSLVPISLTRAATPEAPKLVFLSITKLYRISPLALVGSIASGLILSAFYGLTPIFAQNRGLDLGQVAWLMGAAILGGLIVQWPAGWLSDRFDRRKVLTGSLFAVTVASLAIALVSYQPSIEIYLLSGLFYCLSFVIYPLALGHMNDHCSNDERLAAIGGMLLVYSVGAAVGPIPASWFMDRWGDPFLFVYTGAIAGIAGLFALYRMTRRAGVPLDEQEPFSVMPRTTPVAGELDPQVPADDTGAPAAAANG